MLSNETNNSSEEIKSKPVSRKKKTFTAVKSNQPVAVECAFIWQGSTACPITDRPQKRSAVLLDNIFMCYQSETYLKVFM